MTSFVLDLFRAVFRRKKSISQIVSPMKKIVNDLEYHAATQAKAQSKHEAAAALSRDLADAAEKERQQALAVAANYKGLVASSI